jgi:hypothetical protein
MSACSKVPEDGETGRRAPQTDDTNRAYGAAKRPALADIFRSASHRLARKPGKLGMNDILRLGRSTGL